MYSLDRAPEAYQMILEKSASYTGIVIQYDHNQAIERKKVLVNKRAEEQGAKVGVLPTVPFGVNTGQLDIKLDINMYPSTQAAVLHDVIDSLWRQNIPKFVVMNGHCARIDMGFQGTKRIR